MSYISGVLDRLKKLALFVVFGFLIFWFPGGVIMLGAACHDKPKIDALDYILSVFVPFYGMIVGMIC